MAGVNLPTLGAKLIAKRELAIPPISEFAAKMIESPPGATGFLKYRSKDAEFQGMPITFEQMNPNAFVALGGGLDTAQSLLGSVVIYLVHNPDRRQERIDHPERLATAIEELLRVFPSKQMLCRHAMIRFGLRSPVRRILSIASAMFGHRHVSPLNHPIKGGAISFNASDTFGSVSVWL